MDNDYEKRWNDYFIDGTNVFKNYLGITDYDELVQKETDITFERLVELYEKPIEGIFDKKHLCDIHKYLFGDLYPFAGQYRTVYMTKPNSYFISEKEIDYHLDLVLKEMQDDFKDCHNLQDYSTFLAQFYYDLLTVHPFREGNGRTIREFMREFVDANIPDYILDWSRMNKDDLEEAMENARFTRTLLIMQFEKALIKEKKESKVI